jgi:hypothetical protein
VSPTDVGGGHKVLSFLQHLRHVKQDCHGDRSLYVMGDASERLENLKFSTAHVEFENPK